MLIGNQNVLAKHPGRDIGGGATGLGYQPGQMAKAGRGRFTHPDWEPKSGVPDGYRPPYCWIIPIDPGALAARNNLTGTGTFTAAGAMGLNAEAPLTGTGTLTVTGQLIVSAVAALTGTGTLTASVVAVLNAVAALTGTGTLIGTADALAWGISALTGTGTLTGVSYATGELEAAITPYTELSPAALAAAVWAEPLSTLATDDTTGYALRVLQALGRNRVVTDPAAGTFTVYDDDNTVLLTGDLWEDAAATTAYTGSGAERRDRLV